MPETDRSANEQDPRTRRHSPNPRTPQTRRALPRRSANVARRPWDARRRARAQRTNHQGRQTSTPERCFTSMQNSSGLPSRLPPWKENQNSSPQCRDDPIVCDCGSTTGVSAITCALWTTDRAAVDYCIVPAEHESTRVDAEATSPALPLQAHQQRPPCLRRDSGARPQRHRTTTSARSCPSPRPPRTAARRPCRCARFAFRRRSRGARRRSAP
jgi:hypothetical protein